MIPFRIGSTSYVYPADILPNVRRLAGIVDDVELVLFEVEDDASGTQSNLPAPDVIHELNDLAHTYDLTYTVHLPLDLKFGDVRGYDKARRAIEATRGLDPFAYVMHLDGRVLLNEPNAETLAEWQGSARKAVKQVVEWVGKAERVCVENLERWDPASFASVVDELGVSRCVDIGHLWVEGHDPLPHLRASLPRTRVIHLHGIGTRDHQSLAHMPEDQVRRVLETLVEETYRGVLTLEVFGEDDFCSSRAVMLRLLSMPA